MITGLEIEDLRGFRRLSVDGLGGVTLIVGRDDAGKTSLMAAAVAVLQPTGSAVHRARWRPSCAPP